MTDKKLSIKEAILNRRMLICVFNGFASGLPLYFLVQLIPAWLRVHEVDLTTIGFFGFVLLPFSFKYVWSPLLDKYVPPFLGRRRGWMLISQIFILISMAGFAFIDPIKHIDYVLYLGLFVGFFSATQDIVLDAYRRELLPDEELGIGNSFYANAYRVAGFIPGGLGLILAGQPELFFGFLTIGGLDWKSIFLIMAAFKIISIIHTLMINEIPTETPPPKTLKEAVIGPFVEFFKRDTVKHGLLILAFIFFYKFGDVMATALITPFYIDVGFDTKVIGSVAKVVGLWSMIIGGFAGGIMMIKLGINKSLWIFGVVQMLSILGFAVLNEVGPNITMLSVVVAFEYIGVGLGSAALMAFIAANTNKSFTGTQLALLSSLFSLPKAFTGVMAGAMIEGTRYFDGIGYTNFFLVCTLSALPGMILLIWVAPWNKKSA